MNKRKIYYTLHSGKNSKLTYYIQSYLSIYTPHAIKNLYYRHLMASLEGRKDREYILQRVNYYNQLTADTFNREKFLQESVELRNQQITGQKVYYLDSYRYAKGFPLNYRWRLLPGDITYVPEVPSITKSRPLNLPCYNSIVMKLDKVRHFLFVKDKKKWVDKKNVAIFRGIIGREVENGELKRRGRYDFVKMFHGDPMFDIGVIDKEYPEWHTEKLTIGEHLDYKFIMALEGNDVASNLKWVMSSNSIAVMPRPTCESWFMEGKLIPDYHYIEIKSDYSDLKEKLNYYIAHPDEAQAIVDHAHEFVDQFRDLKREKLISLLVLRKYFDITNG